MTREQGRLNPPVGAQDHAQGSAGAAIALVEYGDYECPHCGRAYPIVKRLQARLGAGLLFVFRNFPLAEVHPHATAAAELAEAAAMGGRFWPMHDMLFEHQDALDDGHLLTYVRALDLDPGDLRKALESGRPKERVRADFTSGVRSGVNGTPTFFINGRRFDGNWTDEDSFAAALRAAAPPSS
ncbi:MAG: thioredoxin domain-containing protein [Alphaproteobacteria bacterium]|nr:thioredoxin domain-containing protein [Alphaproteobacteria bacterium]